MAFFGIRDREASHLTFGEIFAFERDWLPEIMGFIPCSACSELTARAYLRVVGDKHVRIPCSGYERCARSHSRSHQYRNDPQSP